MSSIDDLLFTLDICRRSLPGNAHPVHFERLEEIERILQGKREREKVKQDLQRIRSQQGRTSD